MDIAQTTRLQLAFNDLIDVIAGEIAERVSILVEARIAPPQAPTGHRLLRIASVREKTGLSTSTIYRRIQCGSFPRQVNVGGAAATWLEADIDTWITRQMHPCQPQAASDND